MNQEKWRLYRPMIGASSPAEKEFKELPGTIRGDVLSAMSRVLKNLPPQPRKCPQQVAIRCFTVPAESTNVHVLWAALLRHNIWMLLHFTTSDAHCPPSAAYQLARSRLDDVAA
jgi:hypothetical protein